jgi:hypothetical protein
VVATEFLLLGLVFTLYRQNHFKKPNHSCHSVPQPKNRFTAKGAKAAKETNSQNETHHGDTEKIKTRSTAENAETAE